MKYLCVIYIFIFWLSTGRGVEEETRSCFLLLLTTVANNDKASKDVIREKGGEELARYRIFDTSFIFASCGSDLRFI